jgi:hypothetical protein
MYVQTRRQELVMFAAELRALIRVNARARPLNRDRALPHAMFRSCTSLLATNKQSRPALQKNGLFPVMTSVNRLELDNGGD